MYAIKNLSNDLMKTTQRIDCFCDSCYRFIVPRKPAAKYLSNYIGWFGRDVCYILSTDQMCLDKTQVELTFM